MTRPKRVGRPPAGARKGEKVTEYRQLSARLPPETHRYLNALSTVLRTPQWRVISQAIDAMLAQLPAEDRALVETLVRQKQSRAR